MSLDPFEVRMTFISLLSKLSSSLASIQRVSSFALKHGPKCGDDIWDCLVEECGQVTLNARINLLYFLDTLLDKHSVGMPYKDLIARDLRNLVELVVPETREGILNYGSAAQVSRGGRSSAVSMARQLTEFQSNSIQVIKSWRTRRLLDAEVLDPITTSLEARRVSLHSAPPGTSSLSKFSRNDILRRIEDDRERHKRLRERLWVLPVPGTLFPSLPAVTSTSSTKTSPASPSSPSELSAFLPTKLKAKKSNSSIPPPPTPASAPTTHPNPTGPRGPELAIEIEFDQLWEASEEEMILDGNGAEAKKRGIDELEVMEEDGGGRGWKLKEEDRVAMRRERKRCFVDVD
ncbi:CTD kinase subunit gamma, partial [Phenoliferia sp. Uapishka_3]